MASQDLPGDAVADSAAAINEYWKFDDAIDRQAAMADFSMPLLTSRGRGQRSPPPLTRHQRAAAAADPESVVADAEAGAAPDLLAVVVVANVAHRGGQAGIGGKPEG